MTAAAQTLEVDALAKSFREGFNEGQPYNARDLLTEMALSPWFRAESVTGDDPLRDAALRDAGVARLLTPEELVAKTEALTGYVWGRRFQKPFGFEETRSRLRDPQSNGGYELLYGGIDSDGIITRTGDMTAMMAAVAQSHAVEVSCPIVRREFYYWSPENRMLFDGITMFDTPFSETSAEFEVTAESWETRQNVALQVPLAAGAKTVRLAFTNNLPGGQMDSDGNSIDRNLSLDRLVVRNSSGTAVSEIQLETLGRRNCGHPEEQFFLMHGNCSLEVPVQITSPGTYSLVVVAHQDRAGDEAARLAIEVNSEDGSSQGEIAIRRKLADLHLKLFGVTVALDSPDVNEAFDLFVEVWNRKSSSEGRNFNASQYNCTDSGDHLYFEGILEDVLQFNPGGSSQLKFDVIRPFSRSINRDDPHHTVRTWVVTLTYLMTDYRYLYF